MYSERERDRAMENAGVRQTLASKILFNGGTRKSNDADGPGSTTITHGGGIGIGELVQNANYTNGQTTQATIFLRNNNSNGHHSHGRKNPPNSQQNQTNACVYSPNNNNINNNNNTEQNFSNLNFYAQQPAAHYDVCYQQVCVSVLYVHVRERVPL